MDVAIIRELWKGRAKNEVVSVALWDGKAAHFASQSVKAPCADNSMTMRIIETQHMVSSGSDVLDVGCGTGRYAFALEAMGASVHGTDISPKMIEFARQRRTDMNREMWEKAVMFHGHECPGLAIGVRASQIVMEKFSVGRAADEELVCVTENDACGVDGIQALLGCTMGKGNLIYRPIGKQAFKFFERKGGRTLRLILKPSGGEMSRQERCADLIAYMDAAKSHLSERTKDIPNADKPTTYTGAVTFSGGHGFGGDLRKLWPVYLD